MFGWDVLVAILALCVSVFGGMWMLFNSFKKQLDEELAEMNTKIQSLKDTFVPLPLYIEEKKLLADANDKIRAEMISELRDIKQTLVQAINGMSSRIDNLLLTKGKDNA